MANMRRALALGLLNAASQGLGGANKTLTDERQFQLRQSAARNALTNSQKDYNFFKTLDPHNQEQFLNVKSAGMVDVSPQGNIDRRHAPVQPPKKSPKDIALDLQAKKNQGIKLNKKENAWLKAYEEDKVMSSF